MTCKDIRRTRYHEQKSGAAKRGIEWQFTFESWWRVWDASGKWDQRGVGPEKYVMGRFGDVGPYSPTNVEIITFTQNTLDGLTRRPPFRPVRRRTRLGNGRGWTFRPNQKVNPYQVVVAHVYVGRFPTAEAAEAAYREVIDQRRSAA